MIFHGMVCYEILFIIRLRMRTRHVWRVNDQIFSIVVHYFHDIGLICMKIQASKFTENVQKIYLTEVASD